MNATEAYFAATENGGFDHQRDAYEQGWEDGRVATPQEMLEEFHGAFGGEDDAELRWRLLDEELTELDEAYEANDLVEIADAIADICYVLIGTAQLKGIPFDAVFAEVHRSNMTKLGPDGKPIRRADGKILKPPTYEPPRIWEILYPDDAE